MDLRIITAATLAILAVAGCGSSSTPKSDEEQVKAIYYKFRGAALAKDVTTLQSATCPQFRDEIANPKGWMKDAKAMGDFKAFEPTAGPIGGKSAGSNASAWGRVHFDPGGGEQVIALGGLQVAQIDGNWLVCEK